MMLKKNNVVYICGGNEIASATAVRLHNSGFEIVCVVNENENNLRYHLCIGDAIFQGQKILENVTAATIDESLWGITEGEDRPSKIHQALQYLLKDRKIAVIPQADLAFAMDALPPDVIVNFYSENYSPITIDDAHLVIGAFPLHQPGTNCHIAVETRETYHIGRYYTPNCHIPEAINDPFFKQPFDWCKSPIGGVWVSLKNIGDMVHYNEAIGRVDSIEIRSPFDGQIWGLTHSGKIIEARAAVAQIFQHTPSDAFRYFGYREQAISGGVLEALLHFAMD